MYASHAVEDIKGKDIGDLHANLLHNFHPLLHETRNVFVIIINNVMLQSCV